MPKEVDDMATRREALKQVFKGAGYFAMGGLAWGGLVKDSKAETNTLRPPAALAEKDFLKACIKCGLCVEACPYDTLHLADPSSEMATGTPYFKAREIPCYMCPDVPCVPPCPSGALDLAKIADENQLPDINKAQMGLAVINKESCVAHWGIQCDACYRACPLMDEAISILKSRNERTGKHAFLIPDVNADACTGCGLCEHACITEEPAIKVFRRELVMGKDGDHYVKGWDQNDEQRMNERKKVEQYESDNAHTLDYLNDNEDLFTDE